LKLKKVAMTTSAGTAPMAAARDAKYPSRPVTPSASYAAVASGAK
jgi:hypothetical protein